MIRNPTLPIFFPQINGVTIGTWIEWESRTPEQSGRLNWLVANPASDGEAANRWRLLSLPDDDIARLGRPIDSKATGIRVNELGEPKIEYSERGASYDATTLPPTGVLWRNRWGYNLPDLLCNLVKDDMGVSLVVRRSSVAYRVVTLGNDGIMWAARNIPQAVGLPLDAEGALEMVELGAMILQK